MDNEIWNIVAASIHGEELSPDEESLLRGWLEAGEKNRALYAKLEAFYRSGRGSLQQRIDVRQAWEVNCDRRRARRPARIRRRMLWWGCAAAVVLVVGLSVFFFTVGPEHGESGVEVVETAIVPGSPKATLTLASGEQLDLQREGRFVSRDSSEILNEGNMLEYVASAQKRDKAIEYNTMTVPRGGEYRLKLEDGTCVWLNAETELRFPVVFGKSERRVYLSGEAYFEVAKDAGRPFTVSVDGVDVTALGTEFNITAVQGGGEVCTTLVDGAVKVENGAGAERVLNPEEQAVCRKGTAEIAVEKVNTALYTSWKDGYYAFDKQPLREIMATLERWYDMEAVFADKEAGKLRFSGRLKRYDDISNLLTMIKLTNDVDFKIESRKIIVCANKKRK